MKINLIEKLEKNSDLMSSPEESPAAVADDAAVVKGVLLVGLGHLLADVTDDQVVVGSRIGRRGSGFGWCVVTPGVVVVVVRTVRGGPACSVRHHKGHQAYFTFF